jgi:hypothetical protein
MAMMISYLALSQYQTHKSICFSKNGRKNSTLHFKPRTRDTSRRHRIFDPVPQRTGRTMKGNRLSHNQRNLLELFSSAIFQGGVNIRFN